MNAKEIKGDLITDENIKLALVVAKFNELVTDKLASSCLNRLDELGVSEENLSLIKVPGAREVPLAVKKVLIKDKSLDAVIVLACVIRGETPHFEYVAQEISKGTALLSLEHEVPVIFGVITANSLEEAMDRAGGKMGNKGITAAENAVEMANLISDIDNEL